MMGKLFYSSGTKRTSGRYLCRRGHAPDGLKNLRKSLALQETFCSHARSNESTAGGEAFAAEARMTVFPAARTVEGVRERTAPWAR
jgi:hypothetical protein